MWPERRLLVRSLSHARAAETALRARVAKARAALATLAERVGAAPRRGRPSANANADPRQAASAVLSQHQVADVLRVTWTERHHERTVLAPGGRLATVCDPTAPRISTFTVTLDEAALAAAVARLGWRVYVTNHPATLLPLAQAVLAYRDEYLVERSLGRLKGQPLSLTPMYLSRDDHATGLVRLLSLGLRVLTLLEGSVRRALATPDAAPLAGLYPGNPTRTTRRPSAERLLAAFENLTLTIVRTVGTTLRHLPPLSPLQQRILTLLGCPDDTYARLTAVPRELPP